MNKTIFITGASSGIGKATAKLFASKGWTVIATMRNPEKEKDLTGQPNVIIMPLDMTNPEQIKEIAEKVIASYDVDVLFNNAGYGLTGPLDHYTDEQILRNINTNLIGVIRLTKEFVPFLKNKRSGLIMATTSIAGLVGLPFDSVYNASKWGIEGFMESISYELYDFGIKIKTIAPGVVRSDFGVRSIDRAQLHTENENLSKNYLNYMIGDWKRTSTPEQVAEAVYEATTDDKDQIRYIIGTDANEMYSERVTKGNEGYRKNLTKLLAGKK